MLYLFTQLKKCSVNSKINYTIIVRVIWSEHPGLYILKKKTHDSAPRRSVDHVQ